MLNLVLKIARAEDFFKIAKPKLGHVDSED